MECLCVPPLFLNLPTVDHKIAHLACDVQVVIQLVNGSCRLYQYSLHEPSGNYSSLESSPTVIVPRIRPFEP